jgi:AcrR family transcriptional regulator
VNQTSQPTQLDLAEDELTPRARIRKAALVEFARHGFNGASIRGIAKAAGVSPGLVQHHFGTKEGLREACDEYVMAFFEQSQQRLTQPGAPQTAEFAEAQLDPLRPMIEYLMMSLSSGSDIASRWFDTITEYTHDALTSGRIGPPLDPELDTRAIAATQAAMALGINVFYRHIMKSLGVEDTSEAIVRIGRARLFLASDRVVGPETRSNLEAALDRYEQAKTTGKPPPRSHGDNDVEE